MSKGPHGGYKARGFRRTCWDDSDGDGGTREILRRDLDEQVLEYELGDDYRTRRMPNSQRRRSHRNKFANYFDRWCLRMILEGKANGELPSPLATHITWRGKPDDYGRTPEGYYHVGGRKWDSSLTG